MPCKMDSSENPRSFEKYLTPQGDEGKPKPQAGTNSISTGTKIVPVRKEILLSLTMMNSHFINNDEFPTPTYPETRHAED